MLANKLLRTPLTAMFMAVCLLLQASPSQSDEQSRKWIRFYQANKILQTDRVQFARRKAGVLGCHNFLKKTRVYKLVLFGFGSCTIYTEKDCLAESITEATREKDTLGTIELAPGYAWYPMSEHPQGQKLRSWSCSNTPAPKLPRKKLAEKVADESSEDKPTDQQKDAVTTD